MAAIQGPSTSKGHVYEVTDNGHASGSGGSKSVTVMPTTKTPAAATPSRPIDYKTKRNSRAVVIPPIGASRFRLLRWPSGVAYCAHTNTILVADWGNSRIMRYDMDGSNGTDFVTHGGLLGCFGWSRFGKYQPWDVAISQSGRVFVTDNKKQRVLVFTLDGEYVITIGSHGTDNGKFGDVRGITCHDGCVLVCDQGKHRVTMFTEYGAHIRHIVSGLSSPQYVAVGPGAIIYVTNYGATDDRWNCNIRVYRWDGSPVRQIGARDTAVGTGPGDVTVDHQGNVCVAWCDNHRVEVYDPQGQLQTTFGKPGSDPGEFWWPKGLELLPDGRMVVADHDNHRLQILY